MPWNDRGGPVPERSEHELLAVVKSRAGRIRRRRVVSVSAGAVACLATVVLAVAALAGSGQGGASALRVTGPGPSEPATTPTEPSSSTTTSSTVLPISTTSSSVVRPVPFPAATTPPVTTKPTPTVAPTTTVGPAPSSSTSSTWATFPPLVECTASEVVVSATTEKLTYAPGEVITATLTAQNRSTHPCALLDSGYVVKDAAGKQVGGMMSVDINLPVPGQPPQPWNPGQTLGGTETWQQTCVPANGTGLPGACPPGSYTITATFGPFSSAPATFTIA